MSERGEEAMTAHDPQLDYPLAEKHPDWLSTPSGLSLDEVTLAATMEGRVPSDDLRITPAALTLQAAVAAAAGRPHLARNLARAAELTRLPDELVLSIYTALRPRRSTRSQLEEIAAALEREHGAPENARLVREALEVYEPRGLLRVE
jgi:propanediol dehydratase small subunit